MNEQQRLWIVQARSDFAVYKQLGAAGVESCHQLHYLQMVTEKLGKAYLWGQGVPPTKLTHAGFVHFVRGLQNGRTRQERDRIAQVLGFRDSNALQRWSRLSLPLARSIERLAPALADGGPNPEYPWPREGEAKCSPAEYHFGVWDELQNANGRQFLQALERAVVRFEQYAVV